MYISSKGYIIQYEPGRGWVKQHRLIWENYHNARLLHWGHIHHINHIRIDNRIENLEAMTIKQHSRIHMMGNSYGLRKGRPMRADDPRRIFSEQHKKRIGNALRGKPKSEEHRQNLWKNRSRVLSDDQKNQRREVMLKRYAEMKANGFRWTGKSWCKIT